LVEERRGAARRAATSTNPLPRVAEPAEAPEVSQPPAQDETPTTEIASAEDESIPSAGTDQT
jgi:hypothetical protein